VGIALGAAALARQSAPVVAISILLAVVLVGRRSSIRFIAAGALGMFFTVGWWWYQQWERYRNPIEANLNRPGYMLSHQPLSFFFSIPASLITHPRKPSFMNTLLPRFHAYLWSDWYGGYHQWDDAKRYAATLGSVQSVLGLGGDALVVGGVAAIGVPALLRVARRRDVLPTDAAFAVLTTLFVLAWAGFIATLIRFPQRDSDPVKVRYLLFIAPVCAVFGIAAATGLVRRGGWKRVLLLAWVAVYAVSWALTIETAF
jgi:hypothetical protein